MDGFKVTINRFSTIWQLIHKIHFVSYMNFPRLLLFLCHLVTVAEYHTITAHFRKLQKETVLSPMKEALSWKRLLGGFSPFVHFVQSLKLFPNLQVISLP